MARFSRHQVLEKLEFWKRELAKIDESKSLLIDALISKFGENVVRSEERDFILTSDICYGILDALNPVLFNGVLKHIPIKCMHFDSILSDCKQNDGKHEVYDYEYAVEDPFGLFTTYIETEDPTVKELGLHDRLVSRDPVIYINYDKVYKTSFMFAVAVLCHELIHYYDSLVGEYIEVKRLVAMGKIDKQDEAKAEHQTKTFTDKLVEANEQSVNVIVLGEGKPTEVLDSAALEKMKEAFLEEGQTKVELDPEKSTTGVHIYDGRSFRAYSW